MKESNEQRTLELREMQSQIDLLKEEIVKLKTDTLLAHKAAIDWARKYGELRARLRVYEAKEGPSIIEEMELSDRIITIDGQTFRCVCGCNVFRHPVGKLSIYVCNSCAYRYKGE